jgi:type II secretory pathway component PulF
MPTYLYKAKRGPQDIEEGKIEAENIKFAVKRLKDMGLFPLSIKEELIIQKRIYRIKRADINLFIRELADLINAGFPLAKALSTLVVQSENPHLKKMIKSIKDDIERGLNLSEALKAYPNLFDPFCISMVRVGELGGMLDGTLKKVAEYNESQEELRHRLRGALAYPVLLIIIGAITIFILVSFVIPKFVEIFQDLSQILPLPTRILITISSFMGKFWWIIVILILLGGVIIKYYSKRKRVKLIFDRLKLNLPLIGRLLKDLEISHICYTLANLLERGIPLTEALEVCAQSARNTLYSNRLLSFQKNIKEGEYLSNCLKSTELFPPIVGTMVGVGEESGDLSSMLFKIASVYQERENQNIKTLLSLLEPILILMLGTIIGLVVWSILLPIFQMNIFIE